MIKILNQYFPGRLFVLFATENALILIGVWAVVSYHVGSMRLSLLSNPALFGKALLITAVCQLCLYYADAYDLRKLSSPTELAVRLLQALGAAALFLGAIFYLAPNLRLGAGIAEMTLVTCVAVILCWRILVEWLNRSYGVGERVLLVGSGDMVRALAREIRARQDLPIRVIGSLTEPGVEGETIFPWLPAMGTLDQIEAVVAEHRPSRIVIALRERRQTLPVDVLLTMRLRGTVVEEASRLFEHITGKIPVDSIRPSTLIFADGFRQSPGRRVYSRVFGFMAAILALLLLGPLMLLIALLVKLETHGPVLYRQERVGLNGLYFHVLKFRSMRSDAEKNTGPVWASEDDPRITRVGKLLRKLRLDELPQLINVLQGDMSFVGPRPERPHFVGQLKKLIPFYDLRHSVRPGITGWAQVSYPYGATVEEAKEKLEYDLFYIKNISLSLDLLILIQTIKIVVFGRGSR